MRSVGSALHGVTVENGLTVRVVLEPSPEMSDRARVAAGSRGLRQATSGHRRRTPAEARTGCKEGVSGCSEEPRRRCYGAAVIRDAVGRLLRPRAPSGLPLRCPLPSASACSRSPAPRPGVAVADGVDARGARRPLRSRRREPGPARRARCRSGPIPRRHRMRSLSLGERAVLIAARELGVPYRYGGSSPSGFDCSGLVAWVYGKLGIALPHNAAAQYGYGDPVDPQPPESGRPRLLPRPRARRPLHRPRADDPRAPERRAGLDPEPGVAAHVDGGDASAGRPPHPAASRGSRRRRAPRDSTARPPRARAAGRAAAGRPPAGRPARARCARARSRVPEGARVARAARGLTRGDQLDRAERAMLVSLQSSMPESCAILAQRRHPIECGSPCGKVRILLSPPRGRVVFGP